MTSCADAPSDSLRNSWAAFTSWRLLVWPLSTLVSTARARPSRANHRALSCCHKGLSGFLSRRSATRRTYGAVRAYRYRAGQRCHGGAGASCVMGSRRCNGTRSRLHPTTLHVRIIRTLVFCNHLCRDRYAFIREDDHRAALGRQCGEADHRQLAMRTPETEELCLSGYSTPACRTLSTTSHPICRQVAK